MRRHVEGKLAAVFEEQVQENTEKILVAIGISNDVMNAVLRYCAAFLNASVVWCQTE